MIERHGFASAWFGRRTRSLCKGGRRIGCNFVVVPFGGIMTSITAKFPCELKIYRIDRRGVVGGRFVEFEFAVSMFEIRGSATF